jgi:hypothetical protein
MIVSIGWDSDDWPGDIDKIVTCTSVDGKLVPELATSTVDPPNTGSLLLELKLPNGQAGSLVCTQSVLLGANDTPGRTPPTRSACYKLRGGDPPTITQTEGRTSTTPPAAMPAGPGELAGPAAPAGTAPAPILASPVASTAPLGPPASVGQAAPAARSSRSAPAPGVASTPPARAAFEAARSMGSPAVRTTAPGSPARPAVTPVTSPAAPAASPAAIDAAGAPASALARTGLDNRIPLAGAGLLLALGGSAIIFGEPRRKKDRPDLSALLRVAYGHTAS